MFVDKKFDKTTCNHEQSIYNSIVVEGGLHAVVIATKGTLVSLEKRDYTVVLIAFPL